MSAKLAWWYVRTGLLKRLGAKAYKKPKDKITWVSDVSAMQDQMGLPIHVGGLTSLLLFMRVKTRYSDSITNISLFVDAGTKSPTCFSKKYGPIDFEIH
jgi:hypothetical protein